MSFTTVSSMACNSFRHNNSNQGSHRKYKVKFKNIFGKKNSTLSLFEEHFPKRPNVISETTLKNIKNLFPILNRLFMPLVVVHLSAVAHGKKLIDSNKFVSIGVTAAVLFYL